MRLIPEELALVNLKRQFKPDNPLYQTPAKALEELRQLTGQDFAYDIEAWTAWILATQREALEEVERMRQEAGITKDIDLGSDRFDDFMNALAQRLAEKKNERQNPSKQ